MIGRQQVEELLSRLIEIPSINPNLADGYDEMKLANFVREWLLQHKIDAAIEEVQPGRPNVFAEVGDGDGPTLCLCAHLDTVGVQEMTIAPFQPKVEANRLYGRGSCDMKGGLAAIMCAARALAEQGVHGKLILALVCDEEYTSIGAEAFVQKHAADACILTEPSDLQLVLSHKGFLWGKVTTRGKSAHGSRADIGVSAISKMGPILVTLDTFEKNILRRRTDELVGSASLHVSLIQGGSGISTYASSCEMHLERRTLPSEDSRDVKKELEEIIQQACPDAAIDWYFERPPFQCDPNESIVCSVQQACQQVVGKQARQVGWGVWTDAALFQQAGIPTVNIGPVGGGLHEPVEWVDLDSVVKTGEILFHAANSFLFKQFCCPCDA